MAAYLLLLSVIGTLFALSSLVSSDQVIVVGESKGETKEIRFSPSLEVKASPGLKPSITTLCERIHIQGIARFEHMHKYANALKLTLTASSAEDDIHVCFHRNVTRAVGMCPVYFWKKVSNGLWIGVMSPFDQKIVDIRAARSTVVAFEVSIVEEWFVFRIACLLIGTLLVSSSSTLSRSLAFYNVVTFSVGYLLIALLLLNLLFSHLPSGRTPSGLFIHSSLVAFVGVVVYHSSALHLFMLRSMGIDKELEMMLKVILLWYAYLTGTLLAIISMRRLLINEDMSIDIQKSNFLSWSFLIIGCLLILQSSVDYLLAGGTLITVILVSKLESTGGENEHCLRVMGVSTMQ
ncbi:unnamed protein product [Microthlaspi erraticum]|uniref:DOMON domain-containing protein n=1 Tax=Microthlaspi erraticum TaxID=1685480 RepID=A0A6D2K5A6_9BRAS|nr:unnamed protein product [Microthlaspi erraticum]